MLCLAGLSSAGLFGLLLGVTVHEFVCMMSMMLILTDSSLGVKGFFPFFLIPDSSRCGLLVWHGRFVWQYLV